MRKILKHWLLPHNRNNHRAKALQIDWLFYYALFFLVFNLATNLISRKSPDILGFATDIYIDKLLEATNNIRVSNGLNPLALNPQLSQAANLKAQDMFSYNYWAHNSPQGKTPWDFINSSGYRYSVAGENLAKNFLNSQGVVDAWMASPTHRDNLLKNGYQDIGFAIVNGTLNGEETTLVVQMFGSSGSTPAAPVAAKPESKLTNPSDSQLALAPITEVIPTTSPVSMESETEGISQTQPVGPFDVTQIMPASIVSSTSLPAGISRHPLFNLNTISRDLVFVFIGFMMAVFVVDAYIVSKKKIIRVTGHNLAHMAFLLALFVTLIFTTQGSII